MGITHSTDGCAVGEEVNAQQELVASVYEEDDTCSYIEHDNAVHRMTATRASGSESGGLAPGSLLAAGSVLSECATTSEQARPPSSRAEFGKRVLENYFADLGRWDRERKQRFAQHKEQQCLDEQDENARFRADCLFRERERDLFYEQRRPIGPQDFENMFIVGRGSSAEVSVVRCLRNDCFYAMKKMPKANFFRGKSRVSRAWIERQVLLYSNSPFLEKLHFAFQDADSLYLVLEFAAGGDLMSMLIREHVLREDVVRFYAAEIMLGIDALHGMGVIHRDLKPDNILFSSSGHAKVCDFGLSKSVWLNAAHRDEHGNNESNGFWPSSIPEEQELSQEQRAALWRSMARTQKMTILGTPNYCAPEVLEGEYDNAADWFSFGCILFEMLIGYAPFSSQDIASTCFKIMHLEEYFEIPDSAGISDEACDLLRSLICRRSERISPARIRQHPFFSSIDWNTLHTARPPFVPDLRSEIDLRYFDDFLESMAHEDEQHDDSSPQFVSPSKSALLYSEEDGEFCTMMTPISPELSSIASRKSSRLVFSDCVTDVDVSFAGFTCKRLDGRTPGRRKLDYSMFDVLPSSPTSCCVGTDDNPR